MLKQIKCTCNTCFCLFDYQKPTLLFFSLECAINYAHFNRYQQEKNMFIMVNPKTIKNKVYQLLINLGRVKVPFRKKVINFLKTYKKLHCEGEPYQFSCQQDPSVQRDKQKYKDIFFGIIFLCGSEGPPLLLFNLILTII